MIKYFFIVCIFFVSCQEIADSEKQNKTLEGKLRIHENTAIKSLFPPAAISDAEKNIVINIYEGLMKINPSTFEPELSLAETYVVSEDKKVYTFRLRKYIFFHNENSWTVPSTKKISIEDVKNCFTFLCSSDSLNKFSEIFSSIIQGGKEYFNKQADSVSGIKILDTESIEISLIKPSPEFLYFASDPSSYIYPTEFFKKYSKSKEIHIKAIGTGPFKLQSFNDRSLILVRNEIYYKKDRKGNTLPYLNSVEFKLWKGKKEELKEYKNGNLDLMFDVPSDFLFEIEDIEKTKIEKSLCYNILQLSSYIILINYNQKDVNTIALGKALAYAVNKDYLIEAILNGEEYPGDGGLVPPLFTNYKFNTEPYRINLDSAKYYLKKSGFIASENYLPLKLPRTSEGPFSGERCCTIDAEIQKQWKESLGINTNIFVFSLSKLAEEVTSGKEGVYILPVKGYFPSPQSFLQYFYSKSLYEYPSVFSINAKAYSNTKFDDFFEKALMARAPKEIWENLKKAEELLIKEAGVIPLLYENKRLVLKPYVKGFPVSPYSYFYLGEVYLEKH